MTTKNKFRVGAGASGLTKNLFKVGAVALALGAVATPSKADLLFYDGFNGDTPGALGGQGGWNGGADQNGQFLNVVSGGLTYSDGNNSLATSGSVYVNSGGYYQGAGHAISGASLNTTYYVSAIMGVSGINSSVSIYGGGAGNNNFQFDYTPTSTPGQASASFFDRQYLGGYQFGNSYNTTTDPTIFLVFKLDYSVAGSVRIEGWTNPTLGGVVDQANPALDTGYFVVNGPNSTGGPVDFTAQSISVGTGGYQGVIADELRVGTTWADVTPIASPEPSTWALMFSGFCALFGIQRLRRNAKNV